MKRNTIFLLLLCMYGISCKKFLAEKSQSDLTPQTTESFSELLFGVGYPKYTQLFQQVTFYMDDDVQQYSGSQDIQAAAVMCLPAYSWQPDCFQGLISSQFDGGSNIDSYKNYYQNMVGCNIAIQYADGSSGTQADKNYLKGEAYSLRAYFYLMLVNLYGRPYNDSAITPDKSPGVPLILSANLANTAPARNTVAEVYQQITRDLDSSIYLLGIEKRTGDIYRMNHIAAHLLASRTYLYMGQWDSVISNANYVIQYQPTLMDLNSWLSSGWYVGSSPFIPIIGKGNVETIWTYGSLQEDAPSQTVTTCDVSQDLANQFDPNDLRAQIYFNPTLPFLLLYSNPLFTANKRDFASVGASNNTGNAFRTSEAYLNRAEAYAQKYMLTGDPAAAQNALNDLNKLRAKRFTPATFTPVGTMTPDSLLTFCRNERRRELFNEGQRWFDLRRYGMPSITHYYSPVEGTNLKYVLQVHDPQYTLAIPPTAQVLNPNLVQNPEGPERQPSN